MPSEQLDEVLLTRIQGKDPRAEEELFGKYLPRIKRKVRCSLGGDHPDCDDLTGTILHAVLINIRGGRFRGDSSLARYIYQIANNKIVEYFRRQAPPRDLIRDDHPASLPTQDEMMEREETRKMVRRALDHLKPRHRRVLYWHYYQGLTISEVAHKLQVSPRKVSRMKAYALRRLRKILGADRDFFQTNGGGERLII